MQNIQDKRTGIAPGQIIALKDTNNGFFVDFVIEKEIGRGGSCIVYSATYKQNDIIRHCRLKEFYPADNSNYYYDICRNGTELKIAEAAQEQFELKKERFLDGVKKQIVFYEAIAKTRNQTAYVGGIYEGGNTLFYTMICDQGVSYDCIADKSLIDILKTGKAIAQAVRNYHNYEVSGEKDPILHLDIKPQNIFVLQESREIIKLFDFDSVVHKNELDDSNVMISGSEGYMPYEVRDTSKHYLISEKSDIYSIGAIVFERIVGRKLTMQDEDNGYVNIEYSNPLFANVSVSIFKKLDEFFEKTCLGRIKQRYSDVEELIDAFDELLEYAKPMEYSLKKFLPSVTSSFLGRENELNDIDQELQDSNYVILSGMGGIGKTELAITYANISEQNKKYNCFFINYQENLHSTIINMEFENIEQYYKKNNIDANNKENVFDAKIDLLSKLGNTTLLVIDNMDMNSENVSEAVNEPAFIKLVSCGVKIIFTSRNSFVEHCLSVGTLHEEELLKMIDHDETNIETVKKLIETVEYHTHTVDLIGKNIRESWREIAPETMLACLMSNDIDNDNFDEIISSKDGYEVSETLYGHIKKLFSFVKLSSEEKNTLMNISLFGIEGINIKLYCDLVKSNDIGIIKNLNKKGWVKYNDRTRVVSVHQAIRMLAFNELNPMNTLLYNDIIHSIKQVRIASIEEIHKYIISAIKIANNEFVPNEIRADMYESIAHKINMIGGASSCNSYIFYPGDYFAEAYNIKKNIYDKENRECIIARLNLLSSTTIFRWTKYNKTFEEKFQEIKQICEIADKYYKRDFELLAKIYDSLSYIYRSRTIGAAPDNDRKIALRSNKLALSYKKKLLIKELVFRPKVLMSRKRFKDDRLLKIYISVAYSYLCMGRAVHDKKLSLNYFKRALGISKKVLPQNHFILAQLHYEVARELFELNINSNEWSFYIEKSLEIFETFPAEGLSLILRICNRETAIKCYEKVHDYNKAVNHMHKFINDKKAKECMNISSDVPDWRIEWFVIDEFEKLVSLCDKNADYHSALKCKKHIAGLFEKDIAELMNSYNQEITNSESKEILYDSVVLRCERAIKLYENIIDYAMLHLKPESYKEEQIFNNKRNMLIEKLNEVKERSANVVKK